MIKSIISGCAVLTLSALAVTHAEFSYEQELQQSCNKVKQYASLGKKFYDQNNIKGARKLPKPSLLDCFVRPMQTKPQLNFTDRDIEVANNNVGLAYAKLGQPLWARAWFMLDENQSLVNLTLSSCLPLKRQMICQVNTSVTQVLVSGITSR